MVLRWVERRARERGPLAASLIATKMSVPRTRQALVARPRLEELLKQSLHARLTLVSGPAGFGKSTLVADWLSNAMQEGDAVAWVSLDAADDDPERFWRYVVSALEGARPGTIPDAVELSRAPGVSTDRVVAALVNELASAATDVWLVLDDYHTVRSRAVHDGVAFLLDNVSPRTHVVIITRADPDLPLPRWRVRRELVEVRVADLRFTLDETEFLPQRHQRAEPLGSRRRDARTAHRGLGRCPTAGGAVTTGSRRAEPGDFISRFAGNDKYVVDYLVDEVLAHLDG